MGDYVLMPCKITCKAIYSGLFYTNSLGPQQHVRWQFGQKRPIDNIQITVKWIRKLGEHLDLLQTSRANPVKWQGTYNKLQHTATHCNTLQHTATHCNTLQHTATHCNTLQHTATAHSIYLHPVGQILWSGTVLQCVAVCCGVLQCVAVCCNVLQSEHLDLPHLSRANPVKWHSTHNKSADNSVKREVDLFWHLQIFRKFVNGRLRGMGWLRLVGTFKL